MIEWVPAQVCIPVRAKPMIKMLRVAAAGAVVVLLVPYPALSQNPLTMETATGPATCGDFRREQDGGWTPLKNVTISTPDGCTIQIKAGEFSFQPILPIFCKVDIASLLDRLCGNGH